MGTDTECTGCFPLHHVHREAQAGRRAGPPCAVPIWHLTQVSKGQGESVRGSAITNPYAACRHPSPHMGGGGDRESIDTLTRLPYPLTRAREGGGRFCPPFNGGQVKIR